MVRSPQGTANARPAGWSGAIAPTLSGQRHVRKGGMRIGSGGPIDDQRRGDVLADETDPRAGVEDLVEAEPPGARVWPLEPVDEPAEGVAGPADRDQDERRRARAVQQLRYDERRRPTEPDV